MKNKIEEKLKHSSLKYWSVFSQLIGQDKSNFKRRLFSNIDRINSWLKEIGLELSVKEIDVDKETAINFKNDENRAKIIMLYSTNKNIKVISIIKTISGGKKGVNHYVVLASKIKLNRDEILRNNIYHAQFSGLFNDTYFYEVIFNRFL